MKHSTRQHEVHDSSSEESRRPRRRAHDKRRLDSSEEIPIRTRHQRSKNRDNRYDSSDSDAHSRFSSDSVKVKRRHRDYSDNSEIERGDPVKIKRRQRDHSDDSEIERGDPVKIKRRQRDYSDDSEIERGDPVKAKRRQRDYSDDSEIERGSKSRYRARDKPVYSRRHRREPHRRPDRKYQDSSSDDASSLGRGSIDPSPRRYHRRNPRDDPKRRHRRYVESSDSSTSGEKYRPTRIFRHSKHCPRRTKFRSGTSHRYYARPRKHNRHRSDSNSGSDGSESRYKANDSESRYKPNESESRYKAGESESRYKPNESESRYKPNESESRYKAGESEDDVSELSDHKKVSRSPKHTDRDYRIESKSHSHRNRHRSSPRRFSSEEDGDIKKRSKDKSGLKKPKEGRSHKEVHDAEDRGQKTETNGTHSKTKKRSDQRSNESHRQSRKDEHHSNEESKHKSIKEGNHKLNDEGKHKTNEEGKFKSNSKMSNDSSRCVSAADEKVSKTTADFAEKQESLLGSADKSHLGSQNREPVPLRFQVTHRLQRRSNHSIHVVGVIPELGGGQDSARNPRLDFDENDQGYKDLYQSDVIPIYSVAPGSVIKYRYSVWDTEDELKPVLVQSENFPTKWREIKQLPAPKDGQVWVQKDNKFGDCGGSRIHLELDADDDSDD